MYIFKNYSNQTIKNFLHKKDLLNYINDLCQNNDLPLPTDDQALIDFGEVYTDGQGNRFDGFSLSGFSKTGCRLLGFWGKYPCNEEDI